MSDLAGINLAMQTPFKVIIAIWLFEFHLTARTIDLGDAIFGFQREVCLLAKIDQSCHRDLARVVSLYVQFLDRTDPYAVKESFIRIGQLAT